MCQVVGETFENISMAHVAQTRVRTSLCKARLPFLVALLLAEVMSTDTQQLLQEAWLGGTEGNMSALSQARAWALREVWRKTGSRTMAC